MGQFVACCKGVYSVLAEGKVRCKHIARHYPEDLAQHRKCAGDAACGFQRSTKVNSFV
jgi:hypothetical protein